MNLNEFLSKLEQQPNTVQFKETMATIDACYGFEPTAFINGELRNNSDENTGSCKLFAFAKLHGLSKESTLACFGNYYRNDVLANPEGHDHQNIRNFIKTGWQGVEFEKQALSPRD